MTTKHFTTWSDIAPKLAEHGLDTDVVKTTIQRGLVVHHVTDGWLNGSTKPFDSLTDEDWEEIVDVFVEEHPTWESKAHRRRRHAERLLDRLHESDDPVEPEDFTGRYAVFAWYDKHGHVYPADGETLEGVLDLIHERQHCDEQPEYVEAYYDLDSENCQRHEVQGGAGQLKVTFTLSLDGATKSYGDNADGTFYPPTPTHVEYKGEEWMVHGPDWGRDENNKLVATDRLILKKTPKDRRRSGYDWATVDRADCTNFRNDNDN